MEIRQMMYFMAVAQYGSYSGAAAVLKVSQPTLSLSIKKMEDELGVKLFYYFDRRQRLTDEGMRLLEGSEQIIDTYQTTLEWVRNTESSATGSFTRGGDADKKLDRLREKAQLVPVLKRTHPA